MDTTTPEIAGGSGEPMLRPTKRARRADATDRISPRPPTLSTSVAADDVLSTARPSRILEGLYIGADWDDTDIAQLRSLNIVAVVNVSEEEQLSIDPASIVIENVVVSDDPDADIRRHFRTAFEFIDRYRSSKLGAVLIKSPRGVSRAASICIGYLVHQQNFTLRDAFNHVKRQRQTTRPNVGFFAQLMEYELEQTNTSTMTLADYRRTSMKLWTR